MPPYLLPFVFSWKGVYWGPLSFCGYPPSKRTAEHPLTSMSLRCPTGVDIEPEGSAICVNIFPVAFRCVLSFVILKAKVLLNSWYDYAKGVYESYT